MKQLLFGAALLCLAFAGCNSSSNYKQQTADNSTADTFHVANGSSLTAVENLKDTLHRFVRTADIKFKVSDVPTTTYQIEDITRMNGGFVTSTDLKSTIDETIRTRISTDSSRETSRFTVTNQVTLRVPNTRLDTTLKSIAKLVGYLDYRIIKAEDVSLQLRSKVLEQKRLAKHNGRLEHDIDKTNNKLVPVQEGESILLEHQEQADNALLAASDLSDKVQFSTVQLFIYQQQAVSVTTLADPPPPQPFTEPFGSQLLGSLSFGLEILEFLLVAVIKLWPFLLLFFSCWWLYKKYGILLKGKAGKA